MHETGTAGTVQTFELMRCERCGGDDLHMIQMDFLRRHHRRSNLEDAEPSRRAVAADFRCNDCGCEFRSLRLALI